MIKKILWNKKVLLVFDDVDEPEKLKKLVRKSDRFGLGSRIIITTRDEHLLKEFLVDEIFEVKAVNYIEKLMLGSKRERFGLGSRIIITTRDEHSSKELSVGGILFELEALKYEDAICLFCSKAFKEEQCPDEYLILSQGMVEREN